MYLPTPPLLPVPLADPVALPANRYELEHLRADIKRWLGERETEGVELKRALNVFLTHVEAFKAGRSLGLPDVPAFMEECEQSRLYAGWEWPVWAACRFNDEDCEHIAGFDQLNRYFVQQLADLLKEPKPDTCQAVRLSYQIVETLRATAVSPMQGLLRRVAARLAELDSRLEQQEHSPDVVIFDGEHKVPAEYRTRGEPDGKLLDAEQAAEVYCVARHELTRKAKDGRAKVKGKRGFIYLHKIVASIAFSKPDEPGH